MDEHDSIARFLAAFTHHREKLQATAGAAAEGAKGLSQYAEHLPPTPAPGGYVDPRTGRPLTGEEARRAHGVQQEAESRDYYTIDEESRRVRDEERAIREASPARQKELRERLNIDARKKRQAEENEDVTNFYSRPGREI